MEKHSNDALLLSVTAADGIMEYSEEILARDPSVILAHPYPPGKDSFYVDDVKQIKPGDRIFYSTTAENYPAFVTQDTAALHRAHKELKKYTPGSALHAHFYEEVKRLEEAVVGYHQGHIYIKSMRIVAYVDPLRNLVAVTEGFSYGYAPRVMGAVVRITGFEEDMINEIATEKLEKGLKKHYGADWESDTEHLGIPIVRA